MMHGSLTAAQSGCTCYPCQSARTIWGIPEPVAVARPTPKAAPIRTPRLDRKLSPRPLGHSDKELTDLKALLDAAGAIMAVDALLYLFSTRHAQAVR